MFYFNRNRSENLLLQQRQQYRSFAYDGIKDLIENGIELLNKSHATNNSSYSGVFDNWIEYSQKIVELCTKNFDTNIYLNYLRFLLDINRSYGYVGSADIKVKQCLEYLVKVLSMINNSQ